MLKFNNSDIFTGYLKQLLSSFNLPTYHLYTSDETVVESKRNQTSTNGKKIKYKIFVPYLKDNKIQICTSKQQDSATKKWILKWEHITEEAFLYNTPSLNKTKSLTIKNNKYDTITHVFLGDYLRFQRDYNHLNLMSLYNCFTNEQVLHLDIHPYTKDTSGTVTYKGWRFNSTDQNYKIYKLPVRLFQNYTIAMDSDLPVEVCCGYAAAYQLNTDAVQELFISSYKKFTKLQFSKPQLYTKLAEICSDQADNSTFSSLKMAMNEEILYMFIKVPVKAKSSIVVLEGDYTAYANPVLTIKPKIRTSEKDPGVEKTVYITEAVENHWITNFEADQLDKAVKNFKSMSQLQLLAMNTGISYPFADRLIEYLTYNCITEKDSFYIPDNVARVQNIMQKNNNEVNIKGAWEEKYNPMLYDFMLENKKLSDYYYDILGYVDKDIENTYAAQHIVTKTEAEDPKSKYYEIKAGTKVIIDTLKNTDIYEEV